MSRIKAPVLALLSIGLLGSWIASCKDESPEPACVPGTTRLCAGIDRCQGYQSCLADGSGFGDCDCSGPLRQPSTSGGEDPGTAPVVGRACSEDAQCGVGLICISSSSNAMFGGGAPNGYCTSPCTTDNECTAIDRQSQCVGAPGGSGSLCLRTCRSQDPTSLAENKCLERRDVVCRSEAALGLAEFSGLRQPGWCFPQCGSDEDCPGRVCDLATGVCADARSNPQGLPFGAHCESRDECADGLCVGVAPGEAFCSAPCVVGQPVGCGYGLTANPRGAACAGPLISGFLAAEGDHDVGLCVELCSVDSDCRQAADRNWVCRLSDAAVASYGRPGFCLPPPPPDAGADGGDAGDSGVRDASAVADGG